MMSILKWIFNDILINKRFTLLFVLNLSLGLTGLVTLDSFRYQLNESLNEKSQMVLGADMGISSRQPIPDNKLELMDKVLDKAPSTNMIETYSMVASKAGDSRLVQIKAIDNEFPFYGHIELEKQAKVKPPQSYDILNGNNIWVYPEVLLQLNLNIGDSLRIGTSDYTITDVIKDDSASGITTSMAPRVYMGLNQIAGSGLITPQSLAWYSTLYKKSLPPSELQEIVDIVFDDPVMDESVRVYSHQNVSQQMSRLIQYLNDYLGIVSIAAILLAGIGATFLFRSYVQKKIKEVAILRSLGMTSKSTIGIYVGQVFVLGLLASLISFLLSLFLLPLLSKLMKDLVSVPLNLSVRPEGIALAAILGLIGSLLICLPILVQLKDIKPAILFRSTHIRLKQNTWSLILYAMTLLTVWGLSVWQANSWIVGSLFVVVFLGCGLIIGVAAFFIFRKLDGINMSFRNLSRNPKSTLSCFLALSLGVLLLNVIPQIEASIQAELTNPKDSKLPSLFLFDIQDDQVEKFKTLVNAQGARLGQVSPSVRARLIRVNGELFEKANANKQSFSREEEREARFRNRGFNLSYREKLDSSETIISGRDFQGSFDPMTQEVAEISMETRFADRLDFELGDVLEFEVQGVPVQGRVVNLRSVKWTSFQPNFFIQFQPGVLEAAPKTHIAAIEKLSTEEKNQLQNLIVKSFPNISIIDVTRLVKRLSDISQQMSLAMQFMASLCLIVGFLVMYSIASHQAYERRRDINLIKVLGAPYGFVLKLFVGEFLILASFAGALGILFSIALSYAFSSILFDSIWAWDPMIPLVSFFILILLVGTLAYLSVRKVLNQKSVLYL